MIYVDPAAPGPARDGRAWTTAYREVGEAMRVAQPGDTVAVAQGSYAEEITLKDGVSLRGGYAGGANPAALPDLLAYPTVLSGQGGPAPVVYAPAGVGLTARLEGFHVAPGDYSTTAIMCSQSSPVITNNVVREAGIAINCAAGSLAIVTRNVVQDSNFGVNCIGSSPLVAGNLVTGCNYGIHSGSKASPPITNNTVAENVVGLDLASGAPDVRNNIVSRNETGVAVSFGGLPTFAHNCVSGNTRDFDGVGNVTGASGNIAADPRLLDADNGDFRLAPLSACVDAGDDTAPNLPGTDLDGRPRRQGQCVDIGAYEFASLPSPTGGALRRAGGLQTASTDDVAAMDGQAPAGIDIVDAVRLSRQGR